MYFHIRPLRQNGATYKTVVTFYTKVEINEHQIPVNISTVVDGDKDLAQIKDVLVKALAKGITPSTRLERLTTQTTLKAGELFFKVSAPALCSIGRLIDPAWQSLETALPDAEFVYKIDWMEHNCGGDIEHWNYLGDFEISHPEEYDFFDVLRTILFNLVDAEYDGDRLIIEGSPCGDITIDLHDRSFSITDIAEALYPIYQGE